MRTWALLAFLACGAVPAMAGDPPGYARALIGYVDKVIPEGVVVDGVKDNQIHLVQPFPAGVDHECFAGVGGPILVRGLGGGYQAGQKIEIMVTRSDDEFLFKLDAMRGLRIGTCSALSDSLAFPVDVDWGAGAPASLSESTPAPFAPCPPPASWATNSSDGTH